MNTRSISRLAFAAVLGVFASSVLAACAEVAMSQDCVTQLDALHKDIDSTGIAALPEGESEIYSFSRSKGWGRTRVPPNTVMTDKHGHAHTHTVADLTVIRDQMAIAVQLCKEGQDHEAMLRMDEIRALMKLPEVGHPASHNYTKPPS